MKIFTALLSGTLFGAGLAIADMTNPAKVQAFLDVAGHWDPSLAFVMGAALAVSTIAVQWARRHSRTWLGGRFFLPGPRAVDGKLLAGAAIFGLGWGLAGLCPGPAVASLVTGSSQVAIFVASMLIGMALHRALPALRIAAAGLEPEASLPDGDR